MEKLTINIIKVLLGTLTFCVLFVLPPVYGKYCASKGCCLGRDDDCSSIFPIQGPETLCYCDSFCNRTNTDCCPDFFEFCLGIKPPPLPHRHDAKCCHDDVDYDVGTTLRVNCNTCTCREVLYGFATFHCTQTRCLVREEIIERINDDPEIGWKADEGSMFIGMPRSKGFNQRLGTMKPRPEVMAMSEISSDAATMDIPKHFDAREHWPGLVGDIQDQGDCASSWAVTTSAVASDRFSIQSNGTMNMTLSMQHLVSCNQKGQQGCYGGHLDRAWWFLRKRGVVTGQCYPYKSGMSLDMSMKKGSCYVPGKFAPAICPDPVTYSERYKTSPPYRIAEYPREIQAEIMKNGPVQAAMHVKSDFFLYKSGVYKYTGLTNDTDNVAGDAVGWHSLRILGWGVDKSNPSNHRKYWNTSEFTTHDEDFEVLFINSYIGKGLFAKKDFEGGTLLLEYCGKLLSDNDAAHLESESPNRSDYLFSFQHKGKFLCIDAYFTTSKARYINDAKQTQANTFVKKVEVHGVPRLFIYSKKKIEKGTEIRYDYGNPDAEWRQDICCDLTAVGGDALLDENADGESDIDETTNEGEDKCCDLTAVGGDALLDENADDVSDIDETTNEGEDKCCDLTTGGGDPLSDENANDESDIDETTNEGEDKYCDSTSGRSDPLFDENADDESDIDETTNEGEDKCCDITSGGGVIPLDESVNDESDNAEIAVGGKGIFSTLVPYSDSDSDCSYIIPMPTLQQRRLGSSLWGETSTESSKSPNKKDSAVLRTTATVSNSHDHIEQDSSSDAGNWSPESDVEAEDARGSKPGKRCEKENVAPASSSIKVMKTHNKGKRKWDKHQYCVYCMKTYAKLPRHLEQVHLKEKEVAEALSYDKGSCKRKELLTLLRNKGNHSHNVEVWQSGSGCLIPARRTPFDQSHDEFLPCNLCFGYFSRDNLWKHKKNCFMASESTMKDKRHQSTSALLLPFSQEVSQSFKDTVFASMTYDSISFAARHDHIIVQYGERMFAKLGHERHQVGYISQKMRELARLLLKIKETKPDVKSLYDCISPKQFDTVLEAVRNLAGLDPQTGKYKTPLLALKLGHSLQTCALIVKAECIKSEDPVKEDQADKFSKLAVIEWAHKVGTGARTTLEECKWNKPNMLPLSEDIRQLHAKLSEVIEEKQKLLALSDDVTAWYALAEATLSKLILFNRRRSGEVQRIKLADFERRCHDQGNDDVMDSLSSWEKTLCNKLERIEIRGKRRRKVPVLLTKEMVQVMELLAAKRTLIGVSQTNDYFFARPNFSSMEPLRGADCIRKYALKSGAKHPSNLTSTKLRKQIATVSQILCLKDHELDVLAGFLGHDIRVHREYYRLPENTLQMAKVARLLLLMEKGAVGEFKDKKLDEIEVPLDDPSYTDESEGESEVPYDEEDLETEDKEGQNEIHESEEESDSLASTKKKGSPKQRVRWRRNQTATIEKHFEKHIRVQRVPRKSECEALRRKYPALATKDWKSIKYKVYNIIQQKKK